jgi:2-oxoglutarate dehydrogenase E1 component
LYSGFKKIGVNNQTNFSAEEKKTILNKLNCRLFENFFLHTKYVGQKKTILTPEGG